MSAKWQAPLIEMMSRSGSAETGVDPDAATERQTVETTSRMVKEQETPEPKATKVLARATQATERAQVAVRSSPAHATSRWAAVRELLTAGGKVDGDDKDGRGGDGEGELDELDEGRPCGTREWHRLHAGVSSITAEVVV